MSYLSTKFETICSKRALTRFFYLHINKRQRLHLVYLGIDPINNFEVCNLEYCQPFRGYNTTNKLIILSVFFCQCVNASCVKFLEWNKKWIKIYSKTCSWSKKGQKMRFCLTKHSGCTFLRLGYNWFKIIPVFVL